MDLSNLFGYAPSYLPGLLGEEQARLATQQAQQQGLLGAALGLMQAGAPSRTPIGLGQSIAQGLQAGQQAYSGVLQQRVQEQMLAQQIAEQQRMLREREAARTILPTLIKEGGAQPSFFGQPSPFPQRDEEGNILPGAGTIPGKPEVDINTAMRLLAQAPDVAAKVLPTIESFRKMFAPEKVTLKPGEQVYEVRGGQYVPVAGIEKPEYRQVGDALYDVSGTKPVLVIDAKGKLSGDFANYAKGLYGTDVVSELPPDAFANIQNAIIEQKKAGAIVVDMTGGQKGFENETKLRTEFQGSPESKAFGEMKSAYGQVLEGLNKTNAIGDLAAATKIMKLLDPGSVVRESELALAMKSSGLLDRVTNYASNIINGTKLSNEQRKEFASLANSLFSVSLDAFNEKRSQYSNLAKDYGFDINRVVGPEPNIPGLKTAQMQIPSIPNVTLDAMRAERARRDALKRGQ